MLSKLYEMLLKQGFEMDATKDYINIITGNQEVQIYFENDDIEVYTFEDEECIESKIFADDLTAYMYIRSFL